ncbi:MAG: hypothetical protein WCB15_30725 [Desulfobacterales bacterium]
MNIDNLISGFDFDQSKNDCIIHNFLKTYIDKKSNLSAGDDNKANMLRMQLEDYSDILEQLLKTATCFPSGCENCVGMQKCAGCINQDILADAFVKLQKYL